MILTALDHYVAACDKATLAKRPVVYSCHFDADADLLGTLSVPAISDDQHLSHACHGVMAPFGTSPDVISSFCIADAKAPLGNRRTLFVTRLTKVDQGVNMNHWRVPYGMDDRGRLVHGAPEAAIEAPTAVLVAISTLASQRLSGQAMYEFDEAFKASIVFLDLLAQGRLHEATETDSGGTGE